MVVAGAEVNVGADRIAFAPRHQRDLGVRLQLEEAIDDLHAGALQVARPADVALLVEARPQLDQRGDRLARLGRLAPRLADGRVLRGAVAGLLDGPDRRRVGRLVPDMTPPPTPPD